MPQQRDDLTDEPLKLSTFSGSSVESTPVSSQPPSSSLSTTSTLVIRSASSSPYSPPSIDAGHGVTSSLLLDGSRAIAAVCRPYPIATVGTPQRVDFDIASTSFLLEVRVKADTQHPSEGLCTEVYLPFVHFAASLDRSASLSAEGKDGQSDSCSNLLGEQTPFKSSHFEPLLLDVDVRVSTGNYILKGQRLLWEYEIPAQDSVYRLEVKRNGGALIRPAETRVDSGNWGDVCPTCTVC
jgi:hypothetical protein